MFGQAEKRANISFSYRKYYSFRNKINTTFKGRFHSDMMIEVVASALHDGDTQPAMVISTSPLLVAAYSDEMDAVMMLQFPNELATKYELTAGARLTVSTVYWQDKQCAPDIHCGSGYRGNYSDFMPIVQLFIGSNNKKIQKKTELFSEDIWQKVAQMGADYVETYPGEYRNGFFYFM